MLSIIWYANHSNLTYRGGQGPIIHLEADLRRVVRWAESNGRQWAFSLANARAAYTQFRNRLDQFDELNWNAIAATDFRPPDIKDAKQSEFLIHQSFPWHFVERIGVHSLSMAPKTATAMRGATHRPRIEVRSDWYY